MSGWHEDQAKVVMVVVMVMAIVLREQPDSEPESGTKPESCQGDGIRGRADI